MNIRVNGKEYPWVQVDTLTLDEAIVLQRVSGKSLPEVERSLLEGDLAGIKGLMHISVARAEPSAKYSEIETALGNIPLVELAKVFQEITGEASAPLATEPGQDNFGLQTPSGDNGSLVSESVQA